MPSTDSRPERIHSVRPVPKTMTYSTVDRGIEGRGMPYIVFFIHCCGSVESCGQLTVWQPSHVPYDYKIGATTNHCPSGRRRFAPPSSRSSSTPNLRLARGGPLFSGAVQVGRGCGGGGTIACRTSPSAALSFRIFLAIFSMAAGNGQKAKLRGCEQAHALC